MGKQEHVLVTGAGGFIGHHMVRRLKREGFRVRGVDIKRPEFDETAADEFLLLDLRDADACARAMEGVGRVFHFAADMGGIGYITAYHAAIARNNSLINCNMLEAARRAEVGRLLFSSSACVYPQHLQDSPDVTALREEDAYPADPEPGYGWEKLYAEELCKYYHKDFGLDTAVVRFHNVYGPLGAYQGGKEKAPAAIARKVALTEDGGEIAVWGDGKQTRSFMFVDDCCEGLLRLMASGYHEPLNMGTEELVTVDEVVDIVCEVAGKTLRKKHDLSKPQGVRGRNSDNRRLRDVLGWEPATTFREGMAATYQWIAGQVCTDGGQA